MCARFFVDDDIFASIEAVTDAQSEAAASLRYGDVGPARQAPVIVGKQGRLFADAMTWGFPRYDGKGLVINARSETAAEKPMFRDSFRFRRCVVPAKHFYEWDSAKNLVTFRRPDDPVLYMAGLYEPFSGQNRFTVLTTAANASVSKFHDRMPVLLDRNDLAAWLFDGSAAPQLTEKEMPALASWQDNEQLSLF